MAHRPKNRKDRRTFAEIVAKVPTPRPVHVPDPDDLWAHGCEGKRRLGQQAAMAIVADARTEGIALNAYRCLFGDHWHVGGPLSVRRMRQVAAYLRKRVA